MAIRIETVQGTEGVSLVVSGFDVNQVDLIENRLEQIGNVLRSIIEFDEAVENLPEDLYLHRLKACQAMDLKYQIALSEAKDQALVCQAIAEGSENISDHGFPEFSNG